MGAPLDQGFFILFRGPSQISFFAYYTGPLQIICLHTTTCIWGPLKSFSLHTIWRPPQISFCAYYMYKGPPQVSSFDYYRGPPQISFFTYYMRPPSSQFFRLLYGAPLGQFLRLLCGPVGAPKSVSSHPIWGPPSGQFLCLLYGVPSDQFLRTLYGGLFRSISSLTICGGPLR